MTTQADVGQALHGAGVSVSNLKVKEFGGVTAVYGSVTSDADKRKAEQAIEATFGRIANHIEVQGQPGGVTGTAERQYTVKSGDTLSKIAKQFYGNAGDWKRIQAANADLITNPDLIQPGWNLRIP